MTNKILTISLLLTIAASSSFAFEPIAPNRRNKAKRNQYLKIQQIEKNQKRNRIKRNILERRRPKSVSLLNVSAGNMILPNYSSQEGSFGIDYTVVNRDSFGFRFGAGYAKNGDGAGNSIQTIPLDISVLVNYHDKRKFNLYGGAGFGYTMMQGDVNKSGINYHWLGGAKLNISRQTAFFAEYKKYFLTIDGSNYDSEQVRFGVAFELG